DALRRYNAALKQRNVILKQIAKAGGRPSTQALEVLSAFDAPLVEGGARVTVHRRQALRELTPRATDLYRKIADAKEALSLALSGSVSEASEVENVKAEF